MPISKEYFVELINKLIRLNTADDELREWCRKYTPDTDIFMWDLCMAAPMVELLDKILHKEGHWCDDVSYFVYELECGKKYSEGCITENGKNIDFSCAESLYDYLEEQWNKNE